MARALCLLCLWFSTNPTKLHGFLMEATPTDFGSSNEVISCVERIANEYFTRKENVLIISGDSSIAGEMSRRMGSQFGVNLADKNSRIHFDTVLDLVVFDDESTGDPYGVIENMIVNPRGRYVVVTRADSETLEAAAGKFWRAQIPEVIFLRASGERTIKVFGYEISPRYPNSTKLCLLDIWNGKFLKAAKLFANKFQDMEKHPLIVTVLNYPGMAPEIYLTRDNDETKITGVGSTLVNTFAEKLNFRILIMAEQLCTSWSGSGEWCGPEGRLLRGEADFSFGGMLPIPEVIQAFDYSDIYRWDSLNFVMKFQGKTASWKSVIMPWSLTMWLSHLAVILATTGVNGIVKKFWSLNMLEEYVRHADILKVLVNQGARYPKRTGFRLAFALWLIYGFLTTASYTGSLVKYLSMLSYQEDPNTLEELVESNLGIIGSPMPRFFLHREDPVYRKIRDRFLVSSNFSGPDVEVTKDTTRLMFRTNTILRNWENRVNESMWLHIVKQPIMSFPMFVFMKPGHAYREPLNRFIGHIHSAGLIRKWLADYNAIEAGMKHEQGSVVLTLMHLASVFVILFFGYIISTLAFVHELYRRGR